MVYHFFWPLDALGQWNLHCSCGSLELTLFHGSEPFQKRFFKAIRNSLGSTRWSFCPPENRSDGLVETNPSDKSQSEHSRLYLPLFKIRIMIGFTGTPESTIAFLAWILGYAITWGFLRPNRSSHWKWWFIFGHPPRKPKFRFQDLPRPIYHLESRWRWRHLFA